MMNPNLPRQRRFAVAVAAGIAVLAGAQAQQPSQTTEQRGSQRESELSRADRGFIQDAMRSGMAEVELGRMAQQRASSPQVQQYAQRMVADHGKSNQELTTLANAKFAAADGKPGMSERRHADRMAKLNGAEFDRAYMQHMVESHRETVEKFDKAARDAKDPEVKAYAQRTLPVLRGHLDMAQSLASASGGGSSKGGSGMGGTGSGGSSSTGSSSTGSSSTGSSSTRGTGTGTGSGTSSNGSTGASSAPSR